MRRSLWILTIVVLSFVFAVVDWSGRNQLAAQQPSKEASKAGAKILDLAYVNNSGPHAYGL